MKFVQITLIILLSNCCIAYAQGGSYSNGNIPHPNEQNQNRPDSSLRNSDTTYMKQQWNNGATTQPKSKKNANTNKGKSNNNRSNVSRSSKNKK